MSKSSSPEVIKCIYCKQDRPPSREHVMARSLGGDATRPITCEECNGKVLGRLDQALVERSLVALARIAYTPANSFDVKMVGDHFFHDEAADMHTEVYMTNEFRPVLHPQVHFRQGTREIAIHAPDKAGSDALVGFIGDRIAAGNLRSIHVKVGPFEKCTTSRLVLHREKEGFVRVATAGDETAFFDALETSWKDLHAQAGDAGNFVAEKVAQPRVHVHMKMRLDDVFRAVAKTAFNVLAMDVGVDFALSPEFDELREYVLGRDIRHPERLAPGEIAVDTRFVRMVPAEQAPLVPTEGHVVTILYQPPRLLAYVTLYKDQSFVVVLGTVALNETVVLSHEFSAVRRGNQALDIATVFDRLANRAAARR